MDDQITDKQLREALGGEIDQLVQAVVRAVNEAAPGRIIADSEEPVRDATARFRQVLYEKALRLRQRQSEQAFSPSADTAATDVA